MIGSITISEPERIVEGELAGMYTCQVYLPDQDKTCPPLYDEGSPKRLLETANKFICAYLQEKINRIETLLNEKDIRKKLTEELEWAKKELARR